MSTIGRDRGRENKCIYIYIYKERERKTEIEREKEREKDAETRYGIRGAYRQIGEERKGRDRD